MDITLFRACVEGLPPGVLMHSTAGMAGLTSGSPILRKELDRLTKITASKRTPDQNQRIAEIECEFAIYWQAGRPIIPAPVFRSAIEQAARVTKDGPRVRRGLQVLGTTFDSPILTATDGDRDAIITAAATQHVVKVGLQRLIRTRGGFPEWTATMDIRVGPDIDETDLETWVQRAGAMIGICDWRPDKSGEHGRFTLTALDTMQL